jgi:peroxiredoxin
MELTLLTARLLLAAVFLLAGVAKLVDRKETTKSLRDFGLPPGLAQAVSRLLPAGEIVAAAALVPVSTAWYGACGAVALLSIFTIGIGVSMARGRRPDCRCFGQLHSAPVGWPTLVRNGALAIAAGWLVSRGRLQVGPSPWAHLAAAGGNERRVFIVAACLAGLLFFRVLRQSERAEPESVTIESHAAGEARQIESNPLEDYIPGKIHPTGIGLPVGTPAPEFNLPDITGRKRSLQSLREQGKDIFLVFSSPYCESCQALVPDLSRWMREPSESLNIILVVRGTAKENLAKLKDKDIDISRVLLQPAFEVSEAYDCTSTPAAVLIGADGRIQSDLAVGGAAIQHLMASRAKLSSVPAQSGQDLSPSA